MANYAIGDLQGCFTEFSTLLHRVDFNPSKDHLYLVGDIVARGPDSLACLDYIYRNQDSITITLGNHDLHMIACYYLNTPLNPKDKLSHVFKSDKLSYYVSYLQTQPLAVCLQSYGYFISHAGLNPNWSIDEAFAKAQFAQQCYQSNHAKHFFKNMYLAHPTNEFSQLDEFEKFRFIVNYFTRMRFITANSTLELNAKGALTSNPHLQPWFAHSAIRTIQKDIIFGHWAALEGETGYKNIHALDTGCVWGNSMTLMELNSKKLLTEKSLISSQ